MNSATNKTVAAKIDNHKTLLALRAGFDTPADIATRMGISKAAVGRALKRLESDGAVFFDYAVNGWKFC